jgi:hypothetical protein
LSILQSHPFLEVLGSADIFRGRYGSGFLLFFFYTVEPSFQDLAYLRDPYEGALESHLGRFFQAFLPEVRKSDLTGT